MTRTGWTSARRGISLVELLITMTLAGIVLSSVTMLMMRQARGYEKQRALTDAQETLRGASAVLGWELRHAATGESAPSAISANEVTFRSLTGTGVICGRHSTQPRIGLWRTTGSFNTTVNDSALIWMIGRDRWRVVKVTNTGTGGTMGIPSCNRWPGSANPDIVLEIAVTTKLDTASLFVGAPVRMYQRVRYAAFESGGRWWLGRKVGNAANWDQLTGPLLAPSAGGLAFGYYDSLGVVTNVPARVAAIQYTLRAESQTAAPTPVGIRVLQKDSISTRVALRR